ncbi:DUF4118 domain-containing protein [Lactococcus hircilactis]|uniref:DUF4118 domain-containing protein n=1 Tax=Lactococcus hircilactis TaxID=1494462 RepID=UPI003FA2A8DA
MENGKLRIYFGYAAGVGKTYAMLKDAHQTRKSGIDIVIGYVEPHNRPETTALIKNIESITPKSILYKDKIFYEVDVDKIIDRKPQVVIVDELAHSNIPESRNKKRFQDIEEILRSGIDVYTTLNVQHIESLLDCVEKITGVHVNERIPDDIFDNASQIELIDIDPIKLLDRLNNGKIYQKPQIQSALDNFFSLKKLYALREIALRKTADQVNHSATQKEISYKGSYAKEHILVCVSSSPTSSSVIRSAARLVNAFKGEFTALHVVNENDDYQSKSEKNQLQQNLRLAEQLGAKISIIHGEDLSEQVSEYAKVSNISKLVVGKAPEKSFFKNDKFINGVRESVPDLGIYIIPSSNTTKDNYFLLKRLRNLKVHFNLSDLLKTILMLLCSTLLGFLFRELGFNISNIIILYILGVQINALITKGRIFSFISSLLAVLCFNFFFTIPYFSLRAIGTSYPATFIIMLAAGLITSNLIKRIKEQVRLNSERTHRTEILFQTNKNLQVPETRNETFAVTATALIKLLGRDIVIYPVEDESLQEEVYYPSEKSTNNLASYHSLKERGVAEWVLYNNKRAGATTDTLSASKFLYLSIRRKNAVFAIVGIFMEGSSVLDPFEKEVSFAILGEVALVLEKDVLRAKQQKADLEVKQEQLRSNLLRAISHDLRTPLTSISGNAKLMLDNGEAIKEKSKRELLSYIYDDSLWLTNLIENLLMITRLEGNLSVELQISSLDDVVMEAIKHVDPHLSDHEFKMDIPQMDLFANMDPSLIMQVIINLLNNAVKHTQKGSIIKLNIVKINNIIQVEVSDNGSGIPEKSLSKIFDLLYTSSKNPDSKRGLGIGLALCKTIITVHKGEIYAKNNLPQGTIIGFRIPSMEININE